MEISPCCSSVSNIFFVNYHVLLALQSKSLMIGNEMLIILCPLNSSQLTKIPTRLWSKHAQWTSWHLQVSRQWLTWIDTHCCLKNSIHSDVFSSFDVRERDSCLPVCQCLPTHSSHTYICMRLSALCVCLSRGEWQRLFEGGNRHVRLPVPFITVVQFHGY